MTTLRDRPLFRADAITGSKTGFRTSSKTRFETSFTTRYNGHTHNRVGTATRMTSISSGNPIGQ